MYLFTHYPNLISWFYFGVDVFLYRNENENTNLNSCLIFGYYDPIYFKVYTGYKTYFILIVKRFFFFFAMDCPFMLYFLNVWIFHKIGLHVTVEPLQTYSHDNG